MINPSDYSCGKCRREASWICKYCIHTAEKPPTRFKKKIGVETPKERCFTFTRNVIGTKENFDSFAQLHDDLIRMEDAEIYLGAQSGIVAVVTTQEWKDYFMGRSNIIPNAKEKKIMNKTMYGLKLYIPFEELDQYIRDHVEDTYKDHTFIPVKAEVNEISLDVEISFVSAVHVECDKRYKLDIYELHKENN